MNHSTLMEENLYTASANLNLVTESGGSQSALMDPVMVANSFKIHQIYHDVLRKGLNPATNLPNVDAKPPVWYAPTRANREALEDGDF